MTNNFSCEQLHQDILIQSTQTSLNNHIANTVVHVTEADHTSINKIQGIEKSLSTVSDKVQSIQDNIENNDYVTNEELISKDYITKQSVKDYYVQKSQIGDFATKQYVDDKVSNIGVTTNTPKIGITASTDTSKVTVDVIEQSTGSNAKQEFKFKFTGFDNIDSGSSIDSGYTIISIFTTSDSNTTAPEINQRVQRIPTGWGTESTGSKKYLWRSQGRKNKNDVYITYADYTYWTTPECCGIINGETSEVGVDTDTIDYIYWNTNIDTNIVAPTFTVEESKTAFSTDTYIKDTVNGVARLWYNHPNGVTSSNPYEYASFATYDVNTKTWSKYSIPYIFSHYGIDGKDGDGVEYIYILSETESTPSISYSGVTDDEYQKDDFIPAGGWSDNPQQTDIVNKYQYVAVRKKDGATNMWGKFSDPTLWSMYSKPDDPKDPADVYSSVVYYKYGTVDQVMITETERKTKDVPNGWSKKPTTSSTDQYLYMISSDTVNNVTVKDKDGFYWSDAMRLTGEKGPQGTSGTGADGADINYIYTRTKESTRPTTPTFTVEDLEEYPGQYDQDDVLYGQITWYDHPQGVDSEYQYEWISIAKKPSGTNQVFGFYSEPVLWSKYGDRGIDGDTVEYIYKRSTEEIIPSTPVAKYGDNRDDDIPDGWTDDPSGVSEDWPFEYCSTRTKHCTTQNPKGIWEAYKTPFLWAKYSKDGEKGDPGKPGEPVMINTRKWSECQVGDAFYQGANGDTQVDVIYYNKKYYRCIKSYTLEDKAIQDPTNTTYWVPFDSYSNIATELLLAEEASIDNLLLNYAKAKDAEGNITVEIDGNTGNLVANNATLTNAYVEGAVQASTIGYALAFPQPIQDVMDPDGSLTHSSKSTWKYSNVGGWINSAALQLLDCKQSVYMFQQTASLPNQSYFIEQCGGFVVYAIPSPTIAQKMVLDLYFKYDKQYITEDGNQLLTVFLAVVEPELGLSMDNKKVTPESNYGCYTANSYHSTNPSNTLFNICSYNTKVRPITPYFMILNRQYINASKQTTKDCNLPSHIKLLSDGKSTWYILEIDELF